MEVGILQSMAKRTYDLVSLYAGPSFGEACDLHLWKVLEGPTPN